MQKPGSPVKWEGNACGVAGVGVGAGGEDAFLLPLQRPAAPGTQRPPGHPVPTV